MMCKDDSEEQIKHHFVLIHGAGHGAWCWYRIRSLMEGHGHRVTCLDLKSSGIDPSDPNLVLNFDDYNYPLFAFMSSLPPNQKVILVGHSAGGLSLTDMIHKFAGKIHVAIYVAANMLKYGFCTDQDIKDAVPDLSRYGDAEEVTFDHEQSSPTSIIIKPQFQRLILYNTSPIEDSTLASMLLRPGPLRAFRGAKFEEGLGADQIPRVYIKTLNDRVVKQEQQDAMINRWPPSDVYVLESDHSPFFSAPDLLFRMLLKAASSL